MLAAYVPNGHSLERRDIVSGEDPCRLKQLLEDTDDDVAEGLEASAHELDHQPAVVPVADQGGASVSLAVDDPERIRLVADRHTTHNCGGDSRSPPVVVEAGCFISIHHPE